MDLPNYFRLLGLLKECRKVLHDRFKARYKSLTGNEWEEKIGFGKNLAGILSESEMRLLQEKSKKFLFENGSLDWNLSFLAVILQSEKFVNEVSTEIITKLTTINKVLTKLVCTDVSNQGYINLQQDLITTLKTLGKSKSEIEKMTKEFSNFNLENPSSKPSTQDSSALQEKALIFYDSQQYDQSLEVYLKLLNFTTLSDFERSKVFLSMADCNYNLYLLRNDPDLLDKALSHSKLAIHHSPNNVKAYFRTGRLLESKNKEEKALKYYQKALALSPSEEEIKVKVAKLRDSLGKKQRQEHLFLLFQPRSTEERLLDDFSKVRSTIGIETSLSDIDLMRGFLEREDPVLADVFKAHEYRDGSLSTPQDIKMAAHLYSKAAAKKNAEALFNIAKLTFNGLGVQQDFKLAIEMYKRAARMPPKIMRLKTMVPNVGVAESQHALGLIYEQGIYEDRNYGEARNWYAMAVDNGLGFAANNLGGMLMAGKGGEIKLNEAEKLFVFANEKSDPNAKINLVALYILMKLPEKALFWHKVCLQENSLAYLQMAEENSKAIQLLMEDHQRKEETLVIRSKIEEKDRMGLSHRTIAAEYIENEIYQLDILAKNGSITASELYSSISLSIQAAESFKRNKNSNDFIVMLGLAIVTEKDGCFIPGFFLKTVDKRIQKIISQKKVTEFDESARICYIYLHENDSNVDNLLSFVNKCCDLYPNHSFFLMKKGLIFFFLKRYEEAFEILKLALSIEAFNREFLYFLAVCCRHLNKIKQSIDYYELFLAYSPIDHKNKPEAFYALSLLYLELKEKDKSREMFEKGLESEKMQIPFYLPLISPSKKAMESRFSSSSSEVCQIEEGKVECDPIRKIKILEHRKFIRTQIQMFSKTPNIISNSCLPRLANIQRPVDFLNSRSLSFNQIDLSKDQIFLGFFISVKIIDVPIYGFPSLAFIIEDSNKDVLPLSISNLQDRASETGEKFDIGTEIDIFNPYIRIAADGKVRVRIDDFETVVVKKTGVKCCRVCLKEQCNLFCSRCNMKKAYYCSKECQEFDWKVLKHKYICQL